MTEPAPRDDVTKVPLSRAPEAALTHQLSRADMIRQRAQSAATISAAAAAAVAAAGGLSDLHRYDTAVQVSVGLVVFAWLISVALYIVTIAKPVRPSDALEPDADGLRVNLDTLVREYTENADRVRGRLRWAQRFSRLAITLTVGAFAVIAVAAEKEDEPTGATLEVSEEVLRAIESACPRASKPAVYARLRLPDLSESTVDLSIADKERCPDGPVEIRVRSTGVLAATTKPKPPRDALEELKEDPSDDLLLAAIGVVAMGLMAGVFVVGLSREPAESAAHSSGSGPRRIDKKTK